MYQINLDVPHNVIEEINYKLRVINNRETNAKNLSSNDIGREALAVYKWVVDQLYEGYAVVSADKQKELIAQIATPNLPAKAPSK